MANLLFEPNEIALVTSSTATALPFKPESDPSVH
jgi:hypothetical protein